MRTDGRAFGFRDYTCPVCGKKFIPAPFHLYDDNGVLLCSYSCDIKRKRSKNPDLRIGKPIEQYTPSGVHVATYDSAEQAARAIGLCRANNIRECCRGKCKTSGGYVWRYKKEKTSSDAVESLG